MMLYSIEREVGFSSFACVQKYDHNRKVSTREYISHLQKQLDLGYWRMPYMGRKAEKECSTVIFYSHIRHVPALTKIENDETWHYEYYPELTKREFPPPVEPIIINESERKHWNGNSISHK